MHGFTSSIFKGANLPNIVNLQYNSLLSSMVKLSSGYRINKASDGPADLIISEQLRSRIASLNQEMKNKSLQIAKYETASASTAELRSYLTEIRTLAVQAANTGFNSEAAQEATNLAATSIKDGYNRIVETAEYNGSYLFDGEEGSVATISLLDQIDLSSAEAAEQTISRVDSAIAELDSVQIEIGSKQKYELERGLASMEVTYQNLVAAESQIRDTDIAATFAKFTADMLKFNVSLSLMSHSKLNSKIIMTLIGSR